MSNIITVANATKRFKDKTIFENVSFTFHSGNSYGLVGHNGCGKSLLLKAICGFSKLTSGKITLNDKEIGRDIDFISNAGIVIETPSFMDHLSGFQNLQMIAEIQNKISKEKIEDTMKLLGIFDERNKVVRKYSLGTKQKLRIAQAIMEEPEILILDEPTNGLDKKSVHQLRELLVEFTNRGGLLVMTSHNKEDIDFCCKEVYEFDNRQLIQIR